MDGISILRAVAAAALLAAASLLGGCVHVAPAPVNLGERAAARGAATLDMAAIGRRAAQLAPTAPEAQGLDRLALFAALIELDPKIAQARGAVVVAEREAAAARKAAGPTLTLTSEYAKDPGASSPWLLGGAIDVPLDVGGRRSARIDRASLGVVAARYDLAETVWAERVALHRALVDVFGGAAQAALETRIVALRDAQLAVLGERAKRGEIATLELFSYRQQRAAAARALDNAVSRQAGGLAAVASVLGVPHEALGRAADLRWDDFDRPAALPQLDDHARQRAMAGRADVLRAVVAYDQAEADLRGELARQAPAISIGPGYTWERGLVKLPFAINLALPSFDLNRGAIRAAEARRAAAGTGIETALAGAQGAIAGAEAELRGAMAALARLREAELPQAEGLARRADDQLRLGAIGRAERDAAQLTALEARLAEIDAVARVRLAVIALEDAVRRPLEGPETYLAAMPEGAKR